MWLLHYATIFFFYDKEGFLEWFLRFSIYLLLLFFFKNINNKKERKEKKTDF